MEERFFLVWNPNTGRTAHAHSTVKAAQREAERLASKHPGQHFYTLAAISRSHKIDVTTVDLMAGVGQTLDEEIPF